MGNFAERFKNSPITASKTAGYISTVLQLYLETLADRDGELHLLDMGPVCGENIMFFAQQVKRLSVCDMFIRIDRDRRKGETKSYDLLDPLDYPEQSFHGIHLWDLLDHLGDDDASRIVELCHRMLKPRGLMMAFAFEKPLAESPVVTSFVVQEGYQVTFRPQSHLSLPWHYRNNRQLTLLLAIFPRISSFLSRSGTREFLLERT